MDFMNEEKAFNDLADELFETIVKNEPILATYVGIHKYDHLLPNVSREQILKDIETMENFHARLKSIDSSKLSGENKHDYTIADMFLQYYVFWTKEIRFWEKNPDYVTNVGDGLFPLFTRTFAPVEERAKNIAARLKATEKMLEQAKTCVLKPVKLWTEIAIETCQRTEPFIDLVVTSLQKMVPKKLGEELQDSAQQAKASLKKYEEWLKKDVLPKAKEQFTLKREQYDKLIQIRRLGLTTEEILALGEKYLKELKKSQEEIAKKIKPNATIEEINNLIKSKHPKTFEETLKLYRESMEKAKKFVKEHNIATIPPDEKLEIIETPVFIRHLIPIAAYMSPAAFDKDQTGKYLVTPIEDTPELLREHNYAVIMNTTVHEAYPGHHLHAVCSNKNPSKIRHLIGFGTETIEGYAHWVEEFMKEQGYEDTLETRFARISDALLRAARIIIDVKLCTGEMSFDEAVEMLVKEAGAEKTSAIVEVKRYTLYPTYNLSYLIGKHLIEQLRTEVKRKMGKKYSDKFFIDTILYSGMVPYAVLRQIFEEKIKQQQ
jgi:uncharacterized protein (DUF885 family)